jgi:hypothetical protein
MKHSTTRLLFVLALTGLVASCSGREGSRAGIISVDAPGADGEAAEDTAASAEDVAVDEGRKKPNYELNNPDKKDAGATADTAVGADAGEGADAASTDPGASDPGASDPGPAATDGATPTDPGSDPGPQTIGERCFPGFAANPSMANPQYDDLEPKVGNHCWGTNHQRIAGIERVVILGDSVAVGTPNLDHLVSVDAAHFWRNLLAEWIASQWIDLDTGSAFDWLSWKTYDYFSGKGAKKQSGDFWNCSKWGARTDDLLEGGGQIPECFPEGGTDKTTLIAFTMGGNDISKITQEGGEASDAEVTAGYPSIWNLAHETIRHLRNGVIWLKDPERFPNGSFVIFANPYEFTDGTGEMSACPVASFAGYKPWKKPEALEEIVLWLLEEFMKVAVETDTDLIWMLEHFCGHGFVATGPGADTGNRCYRGPDAKNYFDLTCVHPSEAGHFAIFEMFKAVILE